MTSEPPIGFEYHASRLLLAATFCMLLLAMLAVWASGLPFWLRLGASLAILLAAGRHIRGWMHPTIHALVWRADGSATATLVTHDEVDAAIRHARVLGPLIVLGLDWRGGGRVALWLLPDNLDAACRRQLRMRILGRMAASEPIV